MYFVRGLKDRCEELLCHNLNEKNVSQYLDFAILHELERLKLAIIVFVRSITKITT